MGESFELPVMYKDKEILLPAQLVQYGYNYKIEVEVNEISLFFERDEERNWRAITDTETAQNKTIDKNMIAAIGASLEQLF